MILKKTSHESKGDLQFKKNAFKKALKHYRQALSEEGSSAVLLKKLIETHDRCKEEWTKEDLADSLSWTMELQEIENPALKRVHAKLTPQWQAVTQLIQNLMIAGSEQEEDLIQKIHAHGEFAQGPLIEALLRFKTFMKKTS